MILMSPLSARFSRAWVGRVLAIISSTAVALALGIGNQLVCASGKLVLEIPLYGQVPYKDLISQAESLVSGSIDQQFSQHAENSVEVVVLGNRNGDIIPILSTTVSREQWQTQPQVRAWTQYYASQSLLQRHNTEEAQTIAAAERPSRSPVSSVSTQRRSDIDRAWDDGRLTGTAAQETLSELD